MAIGLLFPSGLGLNVGFVANSGKLSLLLVLGLGVVWFFFSNRKIFSPIKVDWLIISFIVWLFVGSVITGSLNMGGLTSSFALVIATMVWVLSYFSFYFIGRFFRDEYSIRVVFKGLLSILVVCAVIGIIESIFQTNFYGVIGKQFGLVDAGSGGELWRGGLYRARASLDQSIAYGFAMVIGYVLTEYLVNSQRILWGGYIKFLFILTTFLSGSRSAILVGLICIGVINYNRIGKVTKWLFALVLVIALYWVVSHLDTLFFVDESLLAGEDSAVGQSGNLIGRFRDFEFVIRAMDASPFFGVGMGLLHNKNMFAAYYPALVDYYDDALDNMLLSILVESGSTGLLMAIFSFVGIVWYCYRLRKCAEKQFLALMLFIFFSASLSYDLFIFPGAGRLMLLLIALVLSTLQSRSLNIRTVSISNPNEFIRRTQRYEQKAK